MRPSGPLSGSVPIGGAKNSALKLMVACTLAEGRYVLRSVPEISDVHHMCGVLHALGLTTQRRDDGALEVVRGAEVLPEAPAALVERMRASTALIGPLLAATGSVRLSLPGGDDFGTRPIDMHLRGLEALGARFTVGDGVVEGVADRLTGAEITFEYPSVGATENVLMAAVLADGRTTIHNAAREPEIADLAAFLNRMGAQVLGAGGPTIWVEGVERLRAVEHTVIPDRIEAATVLSMLGVAGGEISLSNVRHDHMGLLLEKLGYAGVRVSPDGDGLWAMATGRRTATNVATLPYPGLATDYLPLLVALLTVADGTSYATENVFAGRFRYTSELGKLGAKIHVDGHHMVIKGVDRLVGTPVEAADIRAGAALVVAALAAEGETVISGAEHIDRGYEGFVEKLRAVGVDVTRRD